MQLGVTPLWHDLPVTNLMEDGQRRLRNEQARKVAESMGVGVVRLGAATERLVSENNDQVGNPPELAFVEVGPRHALGGCCGALLELGMVEKGLATEHGMPYHALGRALPTGCPLNLLMADGTHWCPTVSAFWGGLLLDELASRVSGGAPRLRDFDSSKRRACG